MKRLILLLPILLAGCFDPPTPEQKWVTENYRRCLTMNGKLFYSPRKHYVECNRAPIGRMPATLFKEDYEARIN